MIWTVVQIKKDGHKWSTETEVNLKAKVIPNMQTIVANKAGFVNVRV